MVKYGGALVITPEAMLEKPAFEVTDQMVRHVMRACLALMDEHKLLRVTGFPHIQLSIDPETQGQRIEWTIEMTV